jgi:hypothetical protein
VQCGGGQLRVRAADPAWRGAGLEGTGSITVEPIVDADLDELDQLMARYRGRPMDFADAYRPRTDHTLMSGNQALMSCPFQLS